MYFLVSFTLVQRKKNTTDTTRAQEEAHFSSVQKKTKFLQLESCDDERDIILRISLIK
jgi:hypothetical protein